MCLLGWVCFSVCGGVVGARCKAVSEMPRSCVGNVPQATVISPESKSSLTTSGSGTRLALLNAKEQLLQEIKAKRRREMGGSRERSSQNQRGETARFNCPCQFAVSKAYPAPSQKQQATTATTNKQKEHYRDSYMTTFYLYLSTFMSCFFFVVVIAGAVGGVALA